MEIFQQNGFAHMLIKMGLDVVTVFVLIRLIYFPRNKDRDFVFTFIVFNMLVFMVCFSMNSLKLETGFAFGLFALFGILRYRTILVPIKEMTYLFTVIVISIINAVGEVDKHLPQIVASNLVILGVIYFLERIWLKTQQGYKVITYEKINLIKPELRSELMTDLRLRTGLDITAIDIETMNFMNDTAIIKVYYNVENGDNVRRIVEKSEPFRESKVELTAVR